MWAYCIYTATIDFIHLVNTSNFQWIYHRHKYNCCQNGAKDEPNMTHYDLRAEGVDLSRIAEQEDGGDEGHCVGQCDRKDLHIPVAQ